MNRIVIRRFHRKERNRSQEIGCGMFTTKDTKSTKFGTLINRTFVSFVPSW